MRTLFFHQKIGAPPPKAGYFVPPPLLLLLRSVAARLTFYRRGRESAALDGRGVLPFWRDQKKGAIFVTWKFERSCSPLLLSPLGQVVYLYIQRV